MVDSAASYRWSSYRGNAGQGQNKLLTPHIEYVALGTDTDERYRAYRQLVVEADEPGFLTAIRDATNGGLSLVDPALKSKLEADTGRRLEHKKPGPKPAMKLPDLDSLTAELDF